MDTLEQNRRSFLFTRGGIGMSHMLPPMFAGQGAIREGSVLARAKANTSFIFATREMSSSNSVPPPAPDSLALGTQQVMAGTGIPIHRHLKMEEAFFVLEGSGVVLLNDIRHNFEKGGTIFIPRNAGTDLRILITNSSCSGSCHPQAWTAFFVRRAVRQGRRPSN